MTNYGTIYTRKNGLLQGCVRYKGVRKTFYGRDRQIVQNSMNDFVLEMKYNHVNQNNVSLFSEYTEMYLFTYKYGFIKASSFDRLESIYKNHVKGSAIDIPLYKLNDVIVQSYLNSKKSCSVSTLKKIFDLIRSVLFYAYRRKDLEYDIASMLTLPSSEKEVKHIDIYEDEEVRILQDEIKRIITFSSDKREKALFRYASSFIIMLNTGLRAGEMLALTWSDVDFEKNIIHVRNTLNHVKVRGAVNGLEVSGLDKKYIDVIGPLKTKKSYRDIPINNLARECFLHLKCENDGSFVVDNGKGNFLLLRSYQQTFKRVCEHIGIRYKGLHALRHTFASRLICSGASPKVVSDLLGHASVVFTLNRYVHSYDKDKIESVKLLDRN